jgi:hypothetical protein
MTLLKPCLSIKHGTSMIGFSLSDKELGGRWRVSLSTRHDNHGARNLF